MPEVILPCPACGSPVDIVGGDEWHNQHSFFIECQCGVCRVGDTVREDCIKRWNKLPRALRWTHEPPKVAGWYYVRQREDIDKPWSKPRIVSIKTLTIAPSEYRQFAGPIPAPID